jgi:hypothetical protein
MSDAPSRVHRNAQTALQGSSAAAALGPRCDRATLKARLANPLSPLSYTVITTANPPTRCGCSSGVEHNLAKVGVGGSNPLARSNYINDLAIGSGERFGADSVRNEQNRAGIVCEMSGKT